jgi:hypothetical protein
MKILLLSPDQIDRYNWGHQLFRNELGKHHDVLYYGPGYDIYVNGLNVKGIMKSFNPDIIMTYGLRYSLEFKGLNEITDIPKVHIVVDFFPAKGDYKGSWGRSLEFFKKNKYDAYFTRVINQLTYLYDSEVSGSKYWLPFSVDTDIYYKKDIEKEYDIFTSSNDRKDIYPNRRMIKDRLKSKFKIMNGKVYHEQYVDCINKSKIAVISTNAFGSVNMKFTEFTSCGAFVLSDRPTDFNEMGFIDGRHMVLYNGVNDLIDKAEYFLKNDKEREEIADNGMKLVRKNHSNEIRVKQISRILEGLWQ